MCLAELIIAALNAEPAKTRPAKPAQTQAKPQPELVTINDLVTPAEHLEWLPLGDDMLLPGLLLDDDAGVLDWLSSATMCATPTPAPVDRCGSYRLQMEVEHQGLWDALAAKHKLDRSSSQAREEARHSEWIARTREMIEALVDRKFTEFAKARQ